MPERGEDEKKGERRPHDAGHDLLTLVRQPADVSCLVVTYQELVGEGLNVALFMAGLPGAVSATLNDKVLTFLNRARKRRLDPLLYGDVDAFYARAFDMLGVRASAAQRATAAKAAQGSPYLLQLIGHNVVTRAKPDGGLSDQAVADAIAAAGEDFKNDVCETTLAALSGKDVEFLAAMASCGTPCHMSDVANRMNVTPDYAQKYRRRLLDSGVIVSPMRGAVDFDVPYLGDYLREWPGR